MQPLLLRVRDEACHLREHHPTREGEVRAFCFRVLWTFKKPLLRLIWDTWDGRHLHH